MAIWNEEHQMFRDAMRQFVSAEIVPHYDQWEKDGIVAREAWLKAGAMGFLSMDVPEQYGGMGVDDFRFHAIVIEELSRANCNSIGFAIHTDMSVPYILRLGTEEQKRRWLPDAVDGTGIVAIAMTEPNAGSDLRGIRTTAVRDGGDFVINGQKTFISNGILADRVVVFAKTDPDSGSRGMSLFVVERGMDGFERGRNLEKAGLHAQDTAELYFDNVRVSADHLLGELGQGFFYLMHGLPRERLALAIGGLANAEAAFEWTLMYVKERTAFGRPIGKFQHSRFAMAEMKTELTIARTFIDACIMALVEGSLSAEKAAMAKYWITDLQNRVVDQCLQLHGGYGYMEEYPIARAWRDARVQRIYGGTNEIMKEVIGRSLGL
ncbi:MAG: acyl-CoA dehydrogenase family protein [Anaerolineae bacterium]|nr:acyl-CoA dehydrogenase family protein [Anaerolineae bacterium]MCO5195807.1 acyl-CoA dehydrogenase family protein [Anaerolineae bacterium]MCO5196323.1 acyl-CoA dehydrogenase family protein [Anaerolineae bacterium]MCO5204383.1 acyl-CoA dehydrogenase family protein [Anaerolineae bacterium]